MTNTNKTNDDNIFLTDEEVKNLQRKPRTMNTANSEAPDFQNTSEYVKISYSSEGRFWIPSELHFRELNTREVSNLSSSNIDTLLENLIVILNDCVLEDVNIEDMTPEEFLETLIALKLEYTAEHDHFFICENCSVDDYDLDDVKPSTFKLDLTSLNYVDIDESDNSLKEYYRPVLEEFTKEEFKQYLIRRHKDNPIEDLESWTLEKELETIEVKKEYGLNFNGAYYSMRWLKISDIALAQKETDKKYKPKIKKIIKEKYHNVPFAEQKQMKKDKIDKIKEEQNKEIAYYTLAMSLEKIDGDVVSLNQKVDKYTFPQSVANSIGEYLKICQFGLVDKRNIVCDKCSHEQERSLQHTITFIELLPINNATKCKSANNKRNVIFVGI